MDAVTGDGRDQSGGIAHGEGSVAVVGGRGRVHALGDAQTFGLGVFPVIGGGLAVFEGGGLAVFRTGEAQRLHAVDRAGIADGPNREGLGGAEGVNAVGGGDDVGGLVEAYLVAGATRIGHNVDDPILGDGLLYRAVLVFEAHVLGRAHVRRQAGRRVGGGIQGRGAQQEAAGGRGRAGIGAVAELEPGGGRRRSGAVQATGRIAGAAGGVRAAAVGACALRQGVKHDLAGGIYGFFGVVKPSEGRGNVAVARVSVA